jgi:hypothetical protein
MNLDVRMKCIISVVSILWISAQMGCTAGASSTSKTTTSTTGLTSVTSSPATSLSTTSIANQQPIEIVSVHGPLPPINPGGPIVEITLKNVSNESIVFMSATVQLGPVFTFNFNIPVSEPFLPGQIMSSKMTLIGGGFSGDSQYAFEIKATSLTGNTFSYIKQAQITPP